jgi:hypothetical protein
MRVELPLTKLNGFIEMTDETKRPVGRPKSDNPRGQTVWVAAEFLPTILAVLDMLKTAKANLRR